jgi:hypothetical protein
MDEAKRISSGQTGIRRSEVNPMGSREIIERKKVVFILRKTFPDL